MLNATSSTQNNKTGNGRYTPLRKRGKGERKEGHFDCTDLMGTLNAIDDRNIRTVFKQAKDPVELAFDHINKQSLKKVATDAIKDSVSDFKMGFEDLKESATDIDTYKGTLDEIKDFCKSVFDIFTSNKEFIPETV